MADRQPDFDFWWHLRVSLFFNLPYLMAAFWLDDLFPNLDRSTRGLIKGSLFAIGMWLAFVYQKRRLELIPEAELDANENEELSPPPSARLNKN